MKRIVLSSLAGALALLASHAMADDHAMFTGGMDPQAPMNVQTQLCTLNPGKTMAQYNRLNQKYIAWSKKNGVETTYVRSLPFITHGNPNDRSKTEFVEFLVSDHATTGKS
jgi:hypothetical protein